MGFSVTAFIDALNRRTFASAGLSLRTVEIDADTTIRCWVSKPYLSPNPNPKSEKPPLILIHGFGPTATWQWRPQVRPLARRFDLVVPDLVFFGGSTTRSADRSEAFQAACVARLVDALGVAGEVSVVGTSYGGFVAYHVARILGAGRVAIASSDLLLADDDHRALEDRARVGDVSDLMLPRTTEHLRALVGLCIHRRLRFLPEFLLRDFIKSLCEDNLDEKLELLKGLTITNKDKFQVTPLPQDVLIMWGEHDGIFPVEKAYQLKKRLGENARLEIFKNTSHLPHIEDPDRFNEVLLGFLLGGLSSSK